MAKLIYVGSHGVEDPTRAGLVFVGANGARDAGTKRRSRWSTMDTPDEGWHCRGHDPCRVARGERAAEDGGRQGGRDSGLRWLSPRPRGNRPGFGR